MARLSRKERFAGLREQMATNKEESLATNDLDKYAERLKQLNEALNDDVQKLLKRNEGYVEEKPDDFTIPSFEEAKDKLNDVDDKFHDFLKELDINNLNKNIDELIGIKDEKPIEDVEEKVETKTEPIVNDENELVDEITKIIEEEPIKEEPVQEEAQLVDETVNNVEEEPIKEEPIQEEPQPDYVQPALNEEDFKDVTKIIDFDELNKEFNESNESFESDINRLINELLKDKKEPQEEVTNKEDESANQEVEVIEDNTPILVLPVKEVEKPAIEIKKTIINPINEDNVVASLVEIIGPVALYVKKEKPAKEEKPVEEVPASNDEEHDGTTTIVNGNYLDEAIKEANDYNHQEGNKTLDELKDQFYKKEEPVEEAKEKINEEFSNTVTLEIDKVLSEVQKAVEDDKEQTPVVEEKKEDLNETVVFKHPTLAKEATDGLEILPMEETLKLDVIDDTIPFTALEAEEDDDEEESGFGKIINVILIILIVVLLAIIGIIGYFLLAANGVI